MKPLVSVIIATYNRSAVLVHAIHSVLGSSLRDLEVIVVGDQCDDDTAAVVEAIGDDRVRFVNLPVHAGDQSGPNNRGLELARGRFVAFLNHDDLFFPDHLSAGLEQLCEAQGDFLWAATLFADPAEARTLDGRAWPVRIASTPPSGRFDPLVFCLASSWILTRELARRVGPWRPSGELWVLPSQDWIFRVWRSGARMVFRPQPGALVLLGGPRSNSYTRKQSQEHDIYARHLRENPRFRDDLLASARRREPPPRGPRGPLLRVRHMLAAPLRALLIRFGVHPATLTFLVFGPRRRGAMRDRHRQRIGLPPLPPRA